MNRDVEQLFGLLEKKLLLPKTRKLFLSPFNTRSEFYRLIDQEISNAQARKPAYMILKMNSLEDQGMIKKLYDANNAGVDITLIVRGICCLVPGIKGQSERIQVFSLVDRFLEHARVYIFANNGKERMYLASADWMTRNLDRRIEVVFPIHKQHIFNELRQLIELQLQDNTKLRRITAELDNPYVEKAEQAKYSNAQTAIYAYLSRVLTNGTTDESNS
jgi:polyphosphate kinase